MNMVLESPAFLESTVIPVQYGCSGEDISPPLTWRNAPENTVSFALIVDDPDANSGTFVHWLVFNIPADAVGLNEAGPLPMGSIIGINSWDRAGYGGPCPPTGTHRYFFKLYALDTTLSLDASANKDDVLKAMTHHVLATAELMGRYKKS